MCFPGGESFDAMWRRVAAALERIRARHANQRVAIVSHGGVNRIALALALQIAPARMFTIAQSYACINIIDYIDATPIVRMVNGGPAGHLG